MSPVGAVAVIDEWEVNARCHVIKTYVCVLI